MNDLEENATHVAGEVNSENILKNKPRIRGKKRKREDSESSSDADDNLPENLLEIEKNLHASAIKNNLDAVSVKKILKKVVANDHVLALVKIQEEKEEAVSWTKDSGGPLITRAKAKELMKVSPNTAPWNLDLVPIKHIPVKTTPEVTALIAQELPDDEDDEEYEPTHDDVPSDDDNILESSSDLESQPRTPATPRSQKKDSPTIVKDGPFKVPQDVATPVRRKLDLDEEATIALRTRSKLSLSETPIEHIESCFVPPDDLPMPAVDDLWNQFLNECLNPASSARNEEDDEMDPEYNVAADQDANDEDETLEKSILKISKKELSDLMTELMTVMEPDVIDNQLIGNIQGDSNQANVQGVVELRKNKTLGTGNEVPTHWEGKQEPISDEETPNSTMAAKITFETNNNVGRVSVGKSEPVDEYEEIKIQKENIREAPNSINTKSTEKGPIVSSDIPKTSAGNSTVTISVEEQEDLSMDPQSPPRPPASLRRVLNTAPQTVSIELAEPVEMSPEQVSILQQQLRQHVQLSAANFLQLFVHPVHWSVAPKYKEYLETFGKIATTNLKSVVDVCNLRPALELIKSWECSVSENTIENKKMIQFIQDEAEKCRRRSAANSLYSGNFPELYKQVIANSTVFLYPHLLPPMPYRSIITRRRFNYLKSEDSLIVLGLDQFWSYIESNPQIFKPPQKPHPRRRWGLSTTVNLICKHMLPWQTTKALMGHIQSVRKTEDKSNPIVKYFETAEIDPVKHTILPFNPKLTLYEHPEVEIPRIWIKYLSISSNRFKHCPSRRFNVQIPSGIEVQVGKSVEPTEKQPLPIDFIKPINCSRGNILPKQNDSVLVDEVVHTDPTEKNVPNTTNYLVASNIYTLINTSTGAKLMPLQIIQTTTVNSSSAPISSPAVKTVTTDINENKVNDPVTNDVTHKRAVKNNHCPCCILLRKITNKQSLITDYFKRNIERKKECECINKIYPKITNKLKLFVNNYKTHSSIIYYRLMKILNNALDVNSEKLDETTEFNVKDLAAALSFQTKLFVRMSLAKTCTMKHSVYKQISKFDTDSDDPLKLAETLNRAFKVELADMYKEFLGFLTAEQADSIGEFKEYFIRNCVEDLIGKVESQVTDTSKRCAILEHIKSLFTSKKVPSCDICRVLLTHVQDYPELARYVFSLFPHRRKQETEDKCEVVRKVYQNRKRIEAGQHRSGEDQNSISVSDDIEMCDGTEKECEVTKNICEDINENVDYEGDNSDSEEELEEDMPDVNDKERNSNEEEFQLVTTIKYEEIENSELTITETEVQERGETPEMLVMSEDESIKIEMLEWSRDEDKIILELIKKHLTPEERSDKTIIEIIKEKDLLNIITNSLPHKSLEDVTERVLYLLQILLLSDYNKEK